MESLKFQDEFGPEILMEVYDPKTKMHGFLCVDNSARGPGKGGIRMTQTITMKEVFRLARTMTWKTALADLPFGGAKSGIVADPKAISEEKKKELIQSFSRLIKPVCPSKYIAAPDMNTTETDMKWFVEANGSWKAATGKPSNMCVKPGEKCGIPHEYGSTGFGVAHATAVAAEHIDLDLENATVAIEGFGNVGSFVFEHLEKMGAKIVAVSDSKGCIYNNNGLNFKDVSETKEKTGSVINHTGKKIDMQQLFELDVDIIIPAAIPDVINKVNVDKVKARLVVEAANIPMTPEIEEILYKKNKLVVPDIVANAGGVISSYAEYRGQNPKQMFDLVEKKITKNTKLILEKSEKENLKPRDAAMEISIERVRKAMKKKSL